MFPDNAPLPADESQQPTAKAKPAPGCLTVLVFVVCVAGFGLCCAGGMIYLMSVGMRHSEAYRLALATAESSPCVVKRLGVPLKTGWLFSGRMATTNGEGTADLDLPVSGPRASGRLHLFATKFDDQWSLQLLTLTVNGERIHVLPVPSSCDAADGQP